MLLSHIFAFICRVCHSRRTTTSKVTVPFASVCFFVCLWFRKSERLKASVVFTESRSIVTQVLEEEEKEKKEEEEHGAAV